MNIMQYQKSVLATYHFQSWTALCAAVCEYLNNTAKHTKNRIVQKKMEWPSILSVQWSTLLLIEKLYLTAVRKAKKLLNTVHYMSNFYFLTGWPILFCRCLFTDHELTPNTLVTHFPSPQAFCSSWLPSTLTTYNNPSDWEWGTGLLLGRNFYIYHCVPWCEGKSYSTCGVIA